MRVKVSSFLNKLAAVASTQGQKDMLRDIVEHGLDRILCNPWSWNWRERSYTLPAAVSESTGAWTYTQGDDFIELDGPISTLDYTHTGRRFQLGTHWYRALDVAVRNPARVYVDRVIEEDGEVEAESLIFYRDELCIRSAGVRNVSTDLTPKLARLSPGFFKDGYRRGNPDYFNTAEPVAYQDEQPYKIDPPAFPLTVTASATASTFSLGRYAYFATRYDAESGLESDPGPVTIYDATSTNWPLVVYGNPDDPDQIEQGTSYAIRVYRSRLDPNRESCPMYLVQERDPEPQAGTTGQDRILDAALRSRVRYWHGKQTLIRLFPIPDDKIRRITVDAMDSFGYRLENDDTVETGRNGEVDELLEMYVYSRLKYQVGDGTVKGSAQQFNQQLRWLLGQDQKPGDSDDGGVEVHKPLVAGESDNLSWTERLSWSGRGWEVP